MKKIKSIKEIINDLDISYHGLDIVKNLISQNNTKYSTPQIRFEVADITHSKLPDSDLLIVRDCLFHFSFKDIDKTLKNISNQNYKYLLNSSLETILKIDATANIYIKPHPRETFDLFKRNMKKEYIDNKNIKFTNLNSMTLSKNAKLIISFWTSAILESIIFNKPAIEYHIENKNFKKVEPKGSLYKLLGFTTVKNKKELFYFLNNPKKIKKINKNFFKKFNFKRFKI